MLCDVRAIANDTHDVFERYSADCTNNASGKSVSNIRCCCLARRDAPVVQMVLITGRHHAALIPICLLLTIGEYNLASV